MPGKILDGVTGENLKRKEQNDRLREQVRRLRTELKNLRDEKADILANYEHQFRVLEVANTRLKQQLTTFRVKGPGMTDTLTWARETWLDVLTDERWMHPLTTSFRMDTVALQVNLVGDVRVQATINDMPTIVFEDLDLEQTVRCYFAYGHRVPAAPLPPYTRQRIRDAFERIFNDSR